MDKAIIRIKKTFRPYSGSLIGLRLQAAVPNNAARKMVMTSNGPRATDEEAVAFRKPYLIAETGDYSDVDDRLIDAFKRSLAFQGYRTFEIQRPKEDRKLTDEQKAKIEALIDRLFNGG